MKRISRIAGLATVSLAFFGPGLQAATVTYDFDTGTIGGFAPVAGTTTPFVYSVPSTDGPVALSFTSTVPGGGPFKIVLPTDTNVIGGGGQAPPGSTGQFLSSNTAFAGTLISLTMQLQGGAFTYLTIPYALGTYTSQSGADVQSVTAKAYLGSNPTPVFTVSGVASTAGASVSGTITLGSLTGSTLFDRVIFQASTAEASTPGILTLDNISGNAVPEIDPASSVGALALLGCGLALAGGRFRRTASA